MEKKILFISRGLGLGHATRDFLIIERLKQRYDIIVLTHGKAFDFFSSKGLSTINIQQGYAEGDTAHKQYLIGKYIYDENPKLVFADEEISAVIFSAILKIPCIYMTNFFYTDEDHVKTLSLAEKIVFPDLQEYFSVPAEIKQKMLFVGPIVDKVSRTKVEQDKEWIVSKFDINFENLLTILVTAGGREERNISFFKESIMAICSYAKKMQCRINILINLCTVGDSLKRDIVETVISVQSKLVQKYFVDENWNVDFKTFYALSDLVFTRGGHTTLWELACMQKPAIAFPFELNINKFNGGYAIKMKHFGSCDVVLPEQMTAEYITKRLEIILDKENSIRMQNCLNEKTKDFDKKGITRVVAIVDEMINYKIQERM